MGVLDEMEREAEARGKNIMQDNIASNLIRAGKMALSEIAEICGMSLQRVTELAARS